MARCARCCLHQSLRVVNVILNFCGIGMIIYSLWLQKKWDHGVKELVPTSGLLRPWFINTCLGVGIVVCLTTLVGLMVANCINNSVLCIYMISILCLLLLQGVVIVTIFFKIDWASEINEYIDDHHIKFRSFLIFHLAMCCWIVTMVSVAQITVVLLAIVLWAVGFDPRGHSHDPEPPNFRHSFLDVSSSTIRLYLLETCRGYQVNGIVNQVNLGVDLTRSPSFITSLKDILRLRFLHRPRSSSSSNSVP